MSVCILVSLSKVEESVAVQEISCHIPDLLDAKCGFAIITEMSDFHPVMIANRSFAFINIIIMIMIMIMTMTIITTTTISIITTQNKQQAISSDQLFPTSIVSLLQYGILDHVCTSLFQSIR